ncbi:MAG TPA: NADP-dependent phosphogluconate dehydrogenase, partial [Burkholderiaceae bacterium]|nr:NADP-dependent phosphogluconate dehydrogenase [Burkholderiaceae bacterium]
RHADGAVAGASIMKADFAIVGLGRIGGNLARHALEGGLTVAGYSRGGVPKDLQAAGLQTIQRLTELRQQLAPPRIVFVYIPAGQAVDELLDELASILEPGDVVVDGGNSYWGDSKRRADALRQKHIDLLDVGTSGGVEGARRGACCMAGGDAKAVALVEPILKRLAVDGGYVHAGPSGAGHFTKLVHNGIEFGMLQAIGEGVSLLEAYAAPLPVADVLRAWRHGSVIRSWLIDLMEAGYREAGGLDAIPPLVEDTGEVDWLVADAEMEVPVPAMALAVMQLAASRDDRKAWARAIATMRHGFGGHPFGRDEDIARERREGRVGDIVRKQRQVRR